MNAQKEMHRLSELRLYKILDTANEKVFDDLTALASLICEAPISLISLVDDKRQWFKSRHGIAATETPRDQAFCAHAIEGDGVMVVEDACEDERFVDNPLVTDYPNIRFYAGAPLRVNSGAAIGTLCVIDRKPRTLTPTQLQALEVLRNAVVSQLELRRASDDLRELQSVLPMCGWCRKVRTDDKDGKAVWQPLHDYVASLTPITHGICTSCERSFLGRP
ncbi:MAG: GAF domain-containing protein [Pseudomonadota bacterium]